MKIGLVKMAIEEGELDGQLDALIAAAQARRKEVAAGASHALAVGDKAILCGNLTPKYIRGLEVVVVGLNGATVAVDVPAVAQAGKFAGHKRVKVPRTCIRPA